MRHFCYFDLATGVIAEGGGIHINAPSGHEECARANAPPGHGVVEGIFDHLSQRVDVATGKVIDYQPPQPSADHEWHAPSKRWLLSDAATQRQARREAALKEIVRLESQQPRALREAALGQAGAVERLRLIDEQIAALRPQLGG
jgi:hypothetical protein